MTPPADPLRAMNPAIDRDRIHALFHPGNVVLVGASDRHDHWSKRVWDNLARFGFAGRVYPVNPTRTTIWDQPCFKDLAALPEPPDHLAIFTPAETALAILREGDRSGARSATLYAAGFGEGGDPDGLRLGAALRAMLAQISLTVVGPGCMGVGCGESGFVTVPDETLQALAASPVALVAQSGAICGSINRAINELGLRIGYMASCGGQIGCRISDFIDYLAVQPELKVILCYIEAIPDAAHFLAAARHAHRNGVTVVAIKIGGSEAARAAALAHTGSLAGRAEVFDAFAAAAGIVRVDTLEDGIEAVEFLARRPRPRGRNIAVMTNSGALRSLITEAATRSGAHLAPFSVVTAARLGEILKQSDITNPLDTKRTIPTAQYAACLDAIVTAPEVDIVLAAEELPLGDGARRRVDNLLALAPLTDKAAALGKSAAAFTPLLTGITQYGRDVRAQIPQVPILRDTERTLRLLRAMTAADPASVAEADLPAAVDDAFTTAWRARAAALTGATALNEADSKTLLAHYGIPLPAERVVANVAAARQAAREIGYPVVLKAVSADVPHKTDAGLVLIGISDDAALSAGYQTLTARTAARAARFEGVLVARQISGGTECVLGLSRDVEMGPVVMFGLGGVFVELLHDVSFAPPALTRDDAARMVARTRAGQLLSGFRGSRPGDTTALYDALIALGRLARDLGDVIEAVDINPFLVCERGAFALDGLVVLRPPTAVPEGTMS
jgi:acyl-CoA synthetase (NDP forming)